MLHAVGRFPNTHQHGPPLVSNNHTIEKQQNSKTAPAADPKTVGIEDHKSILSPAPPKKEKQKEQK